MALLPGIVLLAGAALGFLLRQTLAFELSLGQVITVPLLLGPLAPWFAVASFNYPLPKREWLPYQLLRGAHLAGLGMVWLLLMQLT